MKSTLGCLSLSEAASRVHPPNAQASSQVSFPHIAEDKDSALSFHRPSLKPFSPTPIKTRAQPRTDLAGREADILHRMYNQGAAPLPRDKKPSSHGDGFTTLPVRAPAALPSHHHVPLSGATHGGGWVALSAPNACSLITTDWAGGAYRWASRSSRPKA